MNAERDPAPGYVATWLALLALLALTVAGSRLHLGTGNTVLSLSIAAAKALLIALVFMRGRRAAAAVRVYAGLGVFWLAIMVSLTLGDLLSRGWLSGTSK